MVFTEVDVYIDLLLQIISMIAYTTIIVKITWMFVPNRFPKLPADKKWPNYLIVFFNALAILILLMSLGLYYSNESEDFGEEFRKMDRMIDEVEVNANNTITKLSKIEIPEIQFRELTIIDKNIKSKTGWETADLPEVIEYHKNFESIRNKTKAWHETSFYNCRSRAKDFGFDWRFRTIENVKLGVCEVSKDMNDKFNSMKQIILNTEKELEKENARISTHLESAIIFFRELPVSLKASRLIFDNTKVKSIENENTENTRLFLPFSSTILFAVLSIVTNIKWGKDIPRLFSIIQCILFYAISFQVVIISTYIAFNVPEDIFTQEPEYFKLFDFEIPSYNNKFLMNSFRNYRQESSTIFSDKENGFVISKYMIFKNLYAELYEIINNQTSWPYGLDSNHVDWGKNEVKDWIKDVLRTSGCTLEAEKMVQEHYKYLNISMDYLNLVSKMAVDVQDFKEFTTSVFEENMNNVKRSTYNPMSRTIVLINQTLVDSDFDCHQLYNTLLNCYISSYQPIPNLYRELFKVSVMGCSALCLVIYLLAFGRRIQTTLELEPSPGNTDTDNKSADAKQPTETPNAPRSPKRF